MIRDTSVEIGELYKRWQVELENRYARRNKVRYIDQLLNELELLNLADAPAMPEDIRRQVRELIQGSEHHLGGKPAKELTVQESMEALYDIQDTLLLGGEEDDEAV
ncbi:MAG: hypothetical protein QOE92_1592 [Chloroflexota bacterium]|jgi:hypothetical protein|nr:hypothetical protein [Chloroflexota bacterium]